MWKIVESALGLNAVSSLLVLAAKTVMCVIICYNYIQLKMTNVQIYLPKKWLSVSMRTTGSPLTVCCQQLKWFLPTVITAKTVSNVSSFIKSFALIFWQAVFIDEKKLLYKLREQALFLCSNTPPGYPGAESKIQAEVACCFTVTSSMLLSMTNDGSGARRRADFEAGEPSCLHLPSTLIGHP